MNEKLHRIGIRDYTHGIFSVDELIKKNVIEKPLDGNHGEIHPKGNDFVDAGVPFIMASDINDGQIDYITCKFITKKQADSLRKGFSKNGDVLVTHKASIGRTAIVDYSNHPFVMLTPQVTFYRIKDKNKLNNKYLKYYFDSDLFQKTLKMWAGSGSTRAYLGITGQQKLPIIKPPIEKQRKIAAILSAYDDLIENNKRRISLLEKMAEEIYREWFVRFRFPGYQNAEFEKGIPKGWGYEKLENLCNLIKRGVSPSYNDEAERLVINQKCIRNGRIDLSKARLHDSKVSDEKYIQYADALINSTGVGTLGRVSVVEFHPVKITVDSHVTVCRANEAKINPLYLAITVSNLKGYFEFMASGSTGQVELNRSLISGIKILVPAGDLMHEFAKKISSMAEQKHIFHKINANLTKTKNQLLPRLISGKLSVENLDIQFPPSMQIEDNALLKEA